MNFAQPLGTQHASKIYTSSASTSIAVLFLIDYSSSVGIHKDVYREIGGFSDKKIGEDLEYWVRIALRYPVSISSKTTAYYFRGTDGVMQSEKKVESESPHPKSLDEVSPSVSVLYRESLKNPSFLKKESIKIYINSRLFTGLKVAAANGDFSLAKSYTKLALPQLSIVNIFFILFQLIPSVALEKLISLYFFVKNNK